MYYCFPFIVVFYASYMLLPLHVLCSKKKKRVYSQVSGDSARFLVFTVGTLVENLLVYGVLYRSKMVQSRIFFVLVC